MEEPLLPRWRCLFLRSLGICFRKKGDTKGSYKEKRFEVRVSRVVTSYNPHQKGDKNRGTRTSEETWS